MKLLPQHQYFKQPKKIKIFLGLQARIMLYFSVLLILILVAVNSIRIYGLPFVGYKGEYPQRQHEVFVTLEMIADTQKKRLVSWLDERSHDASALSESILFRQATMHLHNTVKQLQNHYDTPWEKLKKDKTYQALAQQLGMTKLINEAYTNIQLVDIQTGDILVSTNPEEVGQNLFGKAFFTASLHPSHNGLIDVRQSSDGKHWNLFISRHIRRIDKDGAYTGKVAVLIVTMNHYELTRTLNTHHLNKTHETILVTRDLQILTSAKKAITSNTPHVINSKNFAQHIQTLIDSDKEGETFQETYNENKALLAVYRAIPITGGMRWGLVVKIDKEDAFASLLDSMLYSFFIGLLISILLGLGCTFILARTLSHPLRSLKDTIEQIQAGNLNARADIKTHDEVGVLATLFNQMIEHVQQAQQGMEDTIHENTAELYKTNISLAVTLDEMKELNTHLKQEVAVRREVEAQIRIKQKEQQAIFDSVPAFIWRKDTENCIRWMNQSAAQLSNVAPESITGYSVETLFPERAIDAYKEDQEVFASKKEKLGIITRLKTLTGKDLIVHVDKVPYFNDKGDVIGVIVLAKDITDSVKAEKARQESERKFRSIVNTAVDGIIMINEKGEIQLLNPALARMFGYEIEELQGQKINMLMPEPHRTDHDRYLTKYIETGKPLGQGIVGLGREVEGRRKDGSLFPIHLAVSETCLEGEKHMFTGIISDITELKRTQKALEASKHALEIQNRSYSRFVPREFLGYLGKKTIVDVELGDQVQKEMTIMFSDIRKFTDLSEKMTPTENFSFLNAYLGKMEPVILAHAGFVDKYIGDGIMALFPHSSDDAVKGGIAMLHALSEFNYIREQKQQSPINIGIGLHTGSLMLGTIGGSNRMDGTVISDAVNLASRVEGMTKIYGTSLLITEHTYNVLENINDYDIRIIDKVKVKGKSEPVIIFEILDGNRPDIHQAKLKTLDTFTQAISHYQQREFSKALKLFQFCLSVYPDDKAAKIYIKRCQHWKKFGYDDSWDGITELHAKEILVE